MLVLTRKLGEGIAIGDDIKIIVMQIKGKQVRLGIKAKPSTVVHREEIYQKIHEENKLASQSVAHSLSRINEALDQNIHPKVKKVPLKTKHKSPNSE